MAPSRPKTVYMVRSVTGGKSIEQKDGTLSHNYLSRNYRILINPKVHTFLRSFQVKITEISGIFLGLLLDVTYFWTWESLKKLTALRQICAPLEIAVRRQFANNASGRSACVWAESANVLRPSSQAPTPTSPNSPDSLHSRVNRSSRWPFLGRFLY